MYTHSQSSKLGHNPTGDLMHAAVHACIPYMGLPNSQFMVRSDAVYAVTSFAWSRSQAY